MAKATACRAKKGRGEGEGGQRKSCRRKGGRLGGLGGGGGGCLPAALGVWWNCPYICTASRLWGGLSLWAWRPGTCTLLPAVADGTFEWAPQLRICPSNSWPEGKLLLRTSALHRPVSEESGEGRIWGRGGGGRERDKKEEINKWVIPRNRPLPPCYGSCYFCFPGS